MNVEPNGQSTTNDNPNVHRHPSSSPFIVTLPSHLTFLLPYFGFYLCLICVIITAIEHCDR